MVTPCTLAVGSSTPLESPWLHWPEARGCVRVPYTLIPIAEGAKHGHAPTNHLLRPGSGEAVPRARIDRDLLEKTHTRLELGQTIGKLSRKIQLTDTNFKKLVPFRRCVNYKSLGSSSSPHTPSGRAARAISAKG